MKRTNNRTTIFKGIKVIIMSMIYDHVSFSLVDKLFEHLDLVKIFKPIIQIH